MEFVMALNKNWSNTEFSAVMVGAVVHLIDGSEACVREMTTHMIGVYVKLSH
jgi:hypothetical protein